MKFKIKLIGLISLLSFSAMSNAALSSFDAKGFYLGAGVAGNRFNFDDNYSFDSEFVDRTSFYNRSNEFSSFQISPDFILGYDKNITDRFYTGLKFTANFNQHESSFDDPIYSSNHFTVNNTYSLAIKGGFCSLAKRKVYGLIGAARTSLQHTANFNPAGPFEMIDPAPVSESQGIWGAAVGIGIEQVFGEHWGVGAEYTHVFYKHINADIQPITFSFLGSIGNNSAGLQTDTVMINLLYYV